MVPPWGCDLYVEHTQMEPPWCPHEVPIIHGDVHSDSLLQQMTRNGETSSVDERRVTYGKEVQNRYKEKILFATQVIEYLTKMTIHPTIIDYHFLSSIIIDYHWLSLIITLLSPVEQWSLSDYT